MGQWAGSSETSFLSSTPRRTKGRHALLALLSVLILCRPLSYNRDTIQRERERGRGEGSVSWVRDASDLPGERAVE